MRALKIMGGVALVLALYVGAFLVVNNSVDAKPTDFARSERTDLPQAGSTLDVMIWNLGYAGLGAESDFKVDGGQNYLPPSRTIVRRNADAIAAFLGAQDVDVILNQEIARGGPVNYWVDLKQRVDDALAARDQLFYADFKTRLLPWPLRMTHGQAIYSRLAIEGGEVVSLPAENEGILGTRRRYGSLVSRLPIQGRDHGWTVASVHLAAFDDDAAVRTQQLRELLAWAQREYESGQHVVLGGDFNLQLAETSFPHTTEEQYLFWLFPFPQNALPEGWRIAADPNVPSVRTNERPYSAGENYTTVIDGYIVSPNVVIEEVRGIDLGFANSDHQPVRLRVRAE